MRREGKESGNQAEGRRRGEERLSSRGREGVERWPWMRELVKERVISRVGLEGKGAAKDTFANCLKNSCGDLLDRESNHFQT